MSEYKVPFASQRPESVVIQKPEEAEAIAQLEKLLKRDPSQAKLVSGNGEEVLIPESVYLVLRDIVQMMASGQSIHLIPHTHELTTQEAADILNVSRPFLVKLLDGGEIPFIKVGSHRRIRFQDLMVYKEQRAKKRGKLLDKLIEMSEEAGLYEYKE